VKFCELYWNHCEEVVVEMIGRFAATNCTIRASGAVCSADGSCQAWPGRRPSPGCSAARSRRSRSSRWRGTCPSSRRTCCTGDPAVERVRDRDRDRLAALGEEAVRPLV
jgi:hypothetical protein